MPTHWTYADIHPNENLAQGDIIEPTAEIKQILREVHPHFCNPKYVSFLVLSQSCDLVRRPGYHGQPINVCVVREINSIVGRLLEIFCGSDIPSVYCNETKIEGKRFIERIINQNEQSIGLFFLRNDADAGVATDCVAMLRIAIALHTMHYEKIVAARRGRLRPEFQAKLGWLIGNLYGRIGTEDWSEPPERKREQRRIVDSVMENLEGVYWASSEAIVSAKAANFSIDRKTPSQIERALDGFEPKPLMDRLLDGVSRVIERPDMALTAELRQKILNRLKNDALIAQILRKTDRG